MSRVIELSKIAELYRGFEFRLDKANNAIDSNHVLSVKYDPTLGYLTGVIQASQKKESKTVEIYITNGIIVSASCTCVIGLEGKCHHICALLLYASKNISPTDGACQWSLKRKAKDDNPGCPIDNYHMNSWADSACLPSQDELKRSRKDLPLCGLNLFLDPEPDPASVNLLEVPEEQGLDFRVPPIEEALLSEDFQKCVSVEDKIRYMTDYCALTEQCIKTIAEKTKDQGAGQWWAPLHKHVLSSSNFGAGSRAASGNRCKTVLEAIAGQGWVSDRPKDCKEVKESERARNWGKLHEDTALKEFGEKYPDYTVVKTGLWFHPSGVLAGSPDALVNDNAVAEVKSPYTFRDVKQIREYMKNVHIFNTYVYPNEVQNYKSLSAEEKKEAKKPQQLKNPLCFYVNEHDHLVLKPSHDHYHQMQGQMFCTKRELCHHIVWTPHDMLNLRVHFDDKWVENEVPKLFQTYFNKYVPQAFIELQGELCFY